MYKEYEVKIKMKQGAMAIVKNEVFVGFLQETFYLLRRELTFGGGRNCSRCEVNEKISD